MECRRHDKLMRGRSWRRKTARRSARALKFSRTAKAHPTGSMITAARLPRRMRMEIGCCPRRQESGSRREKICSGHIWKRWNNQSRRDRALGTYYKTACIAGRFACRKFFCFYGNPKLCVGGDAHIAPANCNVFAEISGEFCNFSWGPRTDLVGDSAQEQNAVTSSRAR